MLNAPAQPILTDSFSISNDTNADKDQPSTITPAKCGIDTVRNETRDSSDCEKSENNENKGNDIFSPESKFSHII